MKADAIKLKLILKFQKNIIKTEETKLLEDFETAVRQETKKEVFDDIDKLINKNKCKVNSCSEYLLVVSVETLEKELKHLDENI